MSENKETEVVETEDDIDLTPYIVKQGKSKRGRKPIQIEKRVFEALCYAWCTEDDISCYFNCSADTLNKWCKKTYGKTFIETYNILNKCGNVSLRRTIRRMADKDSKVAIFLAKNRLNMSDDPMKYKRETTTEDKIDKFLDVLTEKISDSDPDE